MTQHVLVVNSGSSSIKYQLVDVDTHEALANGLVERIGQAEGRVKHNGPDGETVLDVPIEDHEAGMARVLAMFADHGPALVGENLTAVGHRVVQGATLFAGPALVTEEVIAQIEELSPLAPLHNPANLSGIRAAMHAFPDTPHVVVFDTAFHQTLAPEAYTYAIDREVAAKYRVRRYGAHGTSHLYVARTTAEYLGKDPADLNLIVLHLGNGASASAVSRGRPVDTSMGLTPVEGLVMGTRPGDLDPGLPGHLARVAGLSIENYEKALSKESGLLALTGSADFRELQDRLRSGEHDPEARLAFDVVVHRLLHYVGGYAAVLGRVDAIAFTAGIGENSPELREALVSRLEGFGLRLDREANTHAPRGQETVISTPESSAALLVIPTNEEWEIAMEAAALVG